MVYDKFLLHSLTFLKGGTEGTGGIYTSSHSSLSSQKAVIQTFLLLEE